MYTTQRSLIFHARNYFLSKKLMSSYLSGPRSTLAIRSVLTVLVIHSVLTVRSAFVIHSVLAIRSVLTVTMLKRMIKSHLFDTVNWFINTCERGTELVEVNWLFDRDSGVRFKMPRVVQWSYTVFEVVTLFILAPLEIAGMFYFGTIGWAATIDSAITEPYKNALLAVFSTVFLIAGVAAWLLTGFYAKYYADRSGRLEVVVRPA